MIALLCGGICFAQTRDSVTCNEICLCKDDQTPAGVMISHVHKKNEWMLSYRYMNMGMSGILSGTEEKTKNDVYAKYLMSPEKMQMNMHMLMAMYGINDRLTAMTMVNYNTTSMDMTMMESASMPNMPGMSMNTNMPSTMNSSGIGDLKLHFLYGLINKKRHQLLASAGVSVPSGNVRVKGKSVDMMYPNKRLPYAMQSGTGTLDFLPCINYLYNRDKMSFSLQGSCIVHPHYNNIGYKWGNEATLNSWMAWQWLNFLSSSIRIEGNKTGKIQGYDPTIYNYNEPSSNPNNYGGKKLNCFVGSVFNLYHIQLGIEYGFPIYQSMNGLQMKLQQTINLSLSIPLNK